MSLEALLHSLSWEPPWPARGSELGRAAGQHTLTPDANGSLDGAAASARYSVIIASRDFAHGFAGAKRPGQPGSVFEVRPVTGVQSAISSAGQGDRTRHGRFLLGSGITMIAASQFRIRGD
jgi:hypothetical protein